MCISALSIKNKKKLDTLRVHYLKLIKESKNSLKMSSYHFDRKEKLCMENIAYKVRNEKMK